MLIFFRKIQLYIKRRYFENISFGVKRIQYSVCFVSRVQSVNNKFIARDILRRPPRGYSSFEYERTFRRTQPLEAHVHAKYLNAPLSSRASSENQQQHQQQASARSRVERRNHSRSSRHGATRPPLPSGKQRPRSGACTHPWCFSGTSRWR